MASRMRRYRGCAICSSLPRVSTVSMGSPCLFWKGSLMATFCVVVSFTCTEHSSLVIQLHAAAALPGERSMHSSAQKNACDRRRGQSKAAYLCGFSYSLQACHHARSAPLDPLRSRALCPLPVTICTALQEARSSGQLQHGHGQCAPRA